MAAQGITAYPLAWPEGWPRTIERKGHNFGSSVYQLTFDRARRQLIDELARLGATDVVLSSNLPVRSDGAVYSDVARRRISDPGVAVYFRLKGRALVMAQDRYNETAANVRSLGLAIEGMRQLDRHGGGHMMERAFTGFAALPPPTSCWAVLGLSPGANAQAIEAAYRAKAKSTHPDVGGSDVAMAELNAARDRALQGEVA